MQQPGNSRLDPLLGQAQSALAQEEWEELRRIVHGLRALDPEAAAPFEKEVAAWERDRAVAAMWAGEWDLARRAVEGWLSLAPENPEAQAMQAQIEEWAQGRHPLPEPVPQPVATEAGRPTEAAAGPIAAPATVEDEPRPRRSVAKWVWGTIAVLAVCAGAIAGGRSLHQQQEGRRWRATAQARSATEEASPPTPLSFGVAGCANFDECPDAVYIWDLVDMGDMPGPAVVENDLELDPALHLYFDMGWCTATPEQLEDNLAKLSWILTVDGQSYSSHLAGESDTLDDGWCQWNGAVIRGWEPGRTYVVDIGYSFDEDADDGWSVYPAGEYVHRFTIHAQEPQASLPRGATEPKAVATAVPGGVWTTYTEEDGLTDILVNAIAVAPDGVVWFGTDSGRVSRLDGETWTTYTPADGLAGGWVNAVTVASDGAVWFGTYKGVSRFDGNTWTTYTQADGLAGDWVDAVAVDPDGALWFGTRDDGVSRFDGDTWTTYTTADGLAHNHVGSIAVAPDGALWFGTSGGVSRFDPASSEDDKWTTFTARDGLVCPFVNAIAVASDGVLWVGTVDGVSRFDGEVWTTYTTYHGLAYDYIWAVAVEPDGTAWFGTDVGGGASRFDGSTWTTYTREQGLSGLFVRAIAVAPDGALWFGGYGVSRYLPPD